MDKYSRLIRYFRLWMSNIELNPIDKYSNEVNLDIGLTSTIILFLITKKLRLFKFDKPLASEILLSPKSNAESRLRFNSGLTSDIEFLSKFKCRNFLRPCKKSIFDILFPPSWSESSEFSFSIK